MSWINPSLSLTRTARPALFCAVALALLAITSSTVHAAGFAKVGLYGYMWEGVFTGTRQTTMGNADVAGAEGPTAILVNAAPLTLGDNVDVEYGRLYFSDTDVEVMGISAAWKGLRAGFCRTERISNPALDRTLYNPEGTVVYNNSNPGTSVAGISYDLGGVIDPDRRLNWTLGVAYRRYFGSMAGVETSANTYDLGTTVGWRTRHASGWFALKGGASWMNVFDDGIIFDERESSLPRAIRTGLTAESTFNSAATRNELLRLVFAYAHTFRLAEYLDDQDHFGAEVVAFRILALRGGHNSRGDGLYSWGAGLILDQPFMGPVSLTVDWGRVDYEFTRVDMWTAGGKVLF